MTDRIRFTFADPDVVSLDRAEHFERSLALIRLAEDEMAEQGLRLPPETPPAFGMMPKTPWTVRPDDTGCEPGQTRLIAEVMAEPDHDCETDGRCCSDCQTHHGCRCDMAGPYGGY